MPRLSLQQRRSAAEVASTAIANLIKLGGLIVVLHEVFSRPEIRSEAIAVAALMMAGAQSIDTFFTSFFGGGKR